MYDYEQMSALVMKDEVAGDKVAGDEMWEYVKWFNVYDFLIDAFANGYFFENILQRYDNVISEDRRHRN